MITDQQRREVAERLRRAPVSDMQTDIYVEHLEQDAAALDCIAVSIRSAGYKRRQLLDVLADLIDRPTCRVESTERWETAGYEHGVDYTLSCGHAVTLGECDELRYCPTCGAEVVV